jgi:hypothetical protein
MRIISTLLTLYLTPLIKPLALTALVILLPYLVLKHWHDLLDTDPSNSDDADNEVAERIRAHRAAYDAALDKRDFWFGPENGVWHADREVINHEEALRRFRERAKAFQVQKMMKEEEKRLVGLWEREVINDQELRLMRRRMAVDGVEKRMDGKDSEENGEEVWDGGDADDEGEEGFQGELARGGYAGQRSKL